MIEYSSSQRTQKKYSFKNDQVLKIFNILVNNNQIELPKLKRPEKVRHTNDPKYCHYHRIVSYPTKKCSILKGKLQALGTTDVLRLSKEMKKVTTYMISIYFRKEQLNRVLVPKVMTRIVNIDKITNNLEV